MKKNIITILVSICVLYCLTAPGYLHSQDLEQQLGKGHPTFREIQDAFNKSWKKNKNIRSGGWKQFKRWEWFAQTRLDSNGYFAPTLNWKGWLEKKIRFGHQHDAAAAALAAWSQLGPIAIPEGFNAYNIGGLGRLNCIAFHPADPAIMWVGAPSGGLWKTIDGGASWTNNTDQLPNLGVSSILVHPQDADIIYIATGDGDGRDTFSIGVLKSTDGGMSWNTTGFSRDVPAQSTIGKILFQPGNPDVILAATFGGIYKSTDAGATWELKSNIPYFRDIDVDEASPAVWYAASHYSGIYKSTDSGETWNELAGGLPQTDFGRVATAISRSSPSVIYGLYTSADNGGFYGLYRSLDGGNSWELRADFPNLLGWDVFGYDVNAGGQGSYDLTLDVDPTNPDIVYVGGVNLWKSTNGGSDWQIIGHWYGAGGTAYVHADQHAFRFHPNAPGTIIVGNDGGVFKSTDGGTSWTDLSAGLAIHQVYRLGQSATNPELIITGNQDNGSDLYTAGTWNNVLGGDGMECAIDPGNSTIMYTSVYFGSFYRSLTGGQSWQQISGSFDGTGAWITPFAIDPQDASTLYAAVKEVFKSTDSGSSWQAISGQLPAEDNLTAMAISPSNSNYIYVSTTNTDIYRTADGGANWDHVTAANGPATTWLTVDPHTPTTVWRTAGGYYAGQKVFRSTDAGVTWQNMSGLLPNIPANCLTIDALSGVVYLGTDLGVFYSPAGNADWIVFDNGLPNVIVNELEIHRNAKKIRAATYGRGVWESPLANIPDIYPPTNASGQRQRNKSLMQQEYLDVLSWESNANNEGKNISGCRIFKMEDGNLVHVTDVAGDTLQYYVRKVENEDVVYYLASFDNENRESTRTYIKVDEI
ncbi:MAG: hypothetical protein GY950_31620 [bacterium]|nr:hypothetical protein [bacterium]